MRKPRERFVYFIKPVAMDGPIKIGCSSDPALRRANIAAWSPFELELITTTPGGSDLEGRIHAYLVEDHWRQEWFNASRKVKTLIESIMDGTFDPAILPENHGAIRHYAKAFRKDTEVVRQYRVAYVRHEAVRYKAGKIGGTYRNIPGAYYIANLSEERQRHHLALANQYIRECEDIIANHEELAA